MIALKTFALKLRLFVNKIKKRKQEKSQTAGKLNLTKTCKKNFKEDQEVIIISLPSEGLL